MSSHIKLGQIAEEHAAAYLEEKGYLILDRNWYFGKKEIDIVALKQDVLYIVEVKSRSYASLGSPAQAVNRKKQGTLRMLATAYQRARKLDLDVQFDIVSIVFNKGGFELEHIEEAILPFEI